VSAEPAQRDTIVGLLLDRLGDTHPGLRTRDRTWTWDEVVRESAARAALALRLRGDPPRDAPPRGGTGPFHIGVLLENVPDYVFWLGAAALAGATIVGINSTKRGATLEAEVRHADLRFVVTDQAGLKLLEGLDIGVPRDRFLLIDDPRFASTVASAVAAQAAEGPALPAGSAPPAGPALPAGPAAVASPEITPRTRMLLLFTSGTTGTSKAAICSQGRLARLAYANCAKYDIARRDVTYCAMPLFHGNAIMALWAPSLAAGATVCLAARFSATNFLPDVRHYGITFFSYVGKAISYILATPESPDDHDNTLTHAFGTEASPDDQRVFLRRFGCRLIEAYGSSESSGMIALAPDMPAGALGRPARPGVQVIDPETTEPCPPAVLDRHGRVTNAEVAIGEIADRDGASRFEGYYNDPAANAERVRHGWYWTGDLGYRDEAGFLYFAGRSGDWIRVDGENISALVTERVLRRHPQVIAAAVYGVPDPRSGDQVMAALELRSVPRGDDRPNPPGVEQGRGVRLEDLGLSEFLTGQEDLGSKGAPRFLRATSALPATGSGKIRKKELQMEGWLCDDPVYQWTGRGVPTYTLMTADDKAALRAEFRAAGRERFLPGNAS
jgi:fatty-acyl-CoA synthase